jgi:hypothetical protein
MSKAKLRQARSLIEKKQFEEARSILETLDGAQARKWLAQIDRQESARPVRSRRPSKILAYLLTLVLSTLLTSGLIVAMIIVTAPSRSDQGVQRATQAVLDVTAAAQAGEPTATRSPTPESISGVVNSTESVNVRNGPGTGNAAIAALIPGTRIVILGLNAEGTRYNIRMDNGVEGWLAAEFVNAEGDVATAVAVLPSETPVPSEVCSAAEAQAWFDENRPYIMEINFVMYQLDTSQKRGITYNAQAGLERLRSNRDAIEAIDGLPCLAQARDLLLSAYRALDNSLTNSINGFPAEAQSELALAVEQINQANPILRGELGIQTALNECGAEIWYAGVDELISEFFTITNGVTVDTGASEVIRAAIFELQRLRREMDVFYPECANTAATHLARSVDAGIGLFQAIMSNDSQDKSRQIAIMVNERDAFFIEMNALGVPVIIQ